MALFVVANWADEQAIAYPGVNAVAVACALGIRQAKEALKTCIASGELARVDHGGGRRENYAQYQVCLVGAGKGADSRTIAAPLKVRIPAAKSADFSRKSADSRKSNHIHHDTTGKHHGLVIGVSRRRRNSDGFHVEAGDLHSMDRLHDLYAKAVNLGLLENAAGDLLRIVSAAVHAARVAEKTGGSAEKLFASNVRAKRWHYASQADEDAAREMIRADEDYWGDEQAQMDQWEPGEKERVRARLDGIGGTEEEKCEVKRRAASKCQLESMPERWDLDKKMAYAVLDAADEMGLGRTSRKAAVG